MIGARRNILREERQIRVGVDLWLLTYFGSLTA
jgi:hypothetical protein